MTRALARWTLFVGALASAACSSDPNPPDTVDCTPVAPVSLAAGQFTILDASETACIRIPGAAGAETEYLYVALSADGTVSRNGTAAPYELQGVQSPSASVAATSEAMFDQAPTPALRFHDMLRTRERALTAQPSVVSASRAHVPVRQAVAVPPDLGSQRTFDVCATTSCDSFVSSTATAKVVGQRVAIYLDDTAPAGFTQADLDEVGALFDAHLYNIDTTAFGRESDLDGNGVVIVLLTQHVNDLSPDCNTTGSIVLGFFFGLDLLPSEQHSNDGEVFYGAVPRQDMPNCSSYTKTVVTQSLPGVFIHEFQHMISFNQHVLVRGGDMEETWLNEGLSHFAEELGGRLVPDSFCPAFNQCEDQFLGDNLFNAYGYLNDPESSFLVAPSTSGGTLTERGAGWLFVRWLGDHFAATQPAATELTRGLLLTKSTGAANVAAVTGVDFPTLVAQWQMAIYVSNLPDFIPSSNRLQYTSFNLRDVYAANFPDVFGKPYPLTPDSTRTGTYDRIGVLRGGSGRHVRIIQPSGSVEAAFVLTDGGGSVPLASTVVPRIALVRVR
ncbi:MAG: hypothetical protein ABJC36_13865 [Gemmatimonadales bacterium]